MAHPKKKHQKHKKDEAKKEPMAAGMKMDMKKMHHSKHHKGK